MLKLNSEKHYISNKTKQFNLIKIIDLIRNFFRNLNNTSQENSEEKNMDNEKKVVLDKLLKQTDKKLKRKINQFGCYFMSMLAIAQIEEEKVFSAEEINQLYDEAVEKNYMTAKCYVRKPDEIAQLAFKKFGNNKRTYQVGRIDAEGEKRFWGWVENNPKYKEYKYLIIRWEMDNDDYPEHFTLGLINEGEIYDPYPDLNKISKMNEVLYTLL